MVEQGRGMELIDLNDQNDCATSAANSTFQSSARCSVFSFFLNQPDLSLLWRRPAAPEASWPVRVGLAAGRQQVN